MTLHASVAATRGSFTVTAELTAQPGRPLALVGPNGAGKSTLVAAIAGLVPMTGSVRLDDRELSALPTEQRRIGVVFQDSLLFSHLTVRDNVAFGTRVRGGGRRASRLAAEPWLEPFGLLELADRRPAELSGGQAQRVALARALASEPELLLLDEPMAALDVEVRDEVRAELAGHLRAFGGPTVVVTHSLADVAALGDDVAVIEGGLVTQRGPLAELRAHPATAYVAKLVTHTE